MMEPTIFIHATLPSEYKKWGRYPLCHNLKGRIVSQ